MPKLLGYAWVSTTEPNVAPQRDAFTRAGCWKVLPDQVTGWLGVAAASRLNRC